MIFRQAPSASENLPAQQNLRDAFAAAAASLNAKHGTGTLTILSSPIDHGTFTYNIANWATLDSSDNHVISHIGNANVMLFEQNAVWTAPAAAAPALSPLMLSVVALLLLLFGLREMHRGHD